MSKLAMRDLVLAPLQGIGDKNVAEKKRRGVRGAI
jgi:hypothetical protein